MSGKFVSFRETEEIKKILDDIPLGSKSDWIKEAIMERAASLPDSGAEPAGSAVSSHQRASSTRGQPEVSIVDIVPAPSGAGSSGKGSIHTTDDGGNGSILTEDPVDPLVEALRVKGLKQRDSSGMEEPVLVPGLVGLKRRRRL